MTIIYPNCIYDPGTGQKIGFGGMPYSMVSRTLANLGTKWLFDPWTGKARSEGDVYRDPFGLKLEPPSKDQPSEPPEEPAPAEDKWQNLSNKVPTFGQVVMTERGLGCWLGTLVGKFIRADFVNGAVKMNVEPSDLFNASYWAVFDPPGLLGDTIDKSIAWAVIDALNSPDKRKAIYPWP